jgi:hypothetical protein
MSHPDPLFDPDNALEDDMNYDYYNDFNEMVEGGADDFWYGEVEADELEDSWDDSYDDSMDGDFDSTMRDCGFGTDEDYGYYGGEDY